MGRFKKRNTKKDKGLYQCGYIRRDKTVVTSGALWGANNVHDWLENVAFQDEDIVSCKKEAKKYDVSRFGVMVERLAEVP